MNSIFVYPILTGNCCGRDILPSFTTTMNLIAHRKPCPNRPCCGGERLQLLGCVKRSHNTPCYGENPVTLFGHSLREWLDRGSIPCRLVGNTDPPLDRGRINDVDNNSAKEVMVLGRRDGAVLVQCLTSYWKEWLFLLLRRRWTVRPSQTLSLPFSTN